MLGIGGFTPLDGFMTRADWEGVCDRMHGRGLFWRIPITLSPKTRTSRGEEVALADPDGGSRSRRLRVSERYVSTRARVRGGVRTTDAAHPGVRW